jgi:hypothetical protein
MPVPANQMTGAISFGRNAVVNVSNEQRNYKRQPQPILPAMPKQRVDHPRQRHAEEREPHPISQMFPQIEEQHGLTLRAHPSAAEFVREPPFHFADEILKIQQGVRRDDKKRQRAAVQAEQQRTM